jgi:hypothetical protein
MCLTTVNRMVQMSVGAIYCVEKCLAGTDISAGELGQHLLTGVCYNEI